jgi:hypothetical protein
MHYEADLNWSDCLSLYLSAHSTLGFANSSSVHERAFSSTCWCLLNKIQRRASESWIPGMARRWLMKIATLWYWLGTSQAHQSASLSAQIILVRYIVARSDLCHRH